MKRMVNTTKKALLLIFLIFILFSPHKTNAQEPYQSLPWIGEKEIGPGGVSVPTEQGIYIGTSREPTNPQIRIINGKGKEILIRIDINNPHGQKPHINIQHGNKNHHTDKDGIELGKGDRIIIQVSGGKVVIERNGKKVGEYEVPEAQGEDVKIEQEPGGKKIGVKKGDKEIATIEVGEDSTVIKAGDKQIEVPHKNKEQKETGKSQGKENKGEENIEKGQNPKMSIPGIEPWQEGFPSLPPESKPEIFPPAPQPPLTEIFPPAPPVPGIEIYPPTPPKPPKEILRPPPLLPPPVFRGIPKIGGVFLYKTAEVSGVFPEDIEAGLIDPETGGFALVINGENVSLPDTYFNDFLSVLFAVYYGDEAPGISIDPICNDCERMLTRYIGKTRYTPMGKILFDADRLMKCYWLGKDNITGTPLKPPIDGFKNAFECLKEEGLYYLGAWVRFWFKPSVMKLKKCGDAIIFDEAKIGLYTEYLFKDKEALTEPAAQAYADFFTDHYDEFAKYNPIYGQLLEYAKMVAIARYLKENGIPLGWLLQANIDRLPWTETPDSTPALSVADEDINIKIYGGVDYDFTNSYVIDKESAKVIEKAISEGKLKIASGKSSLFSSGSGLSPQTQTFKLEDSSYTIIPINRLMKETEYEGLAFRTDLALWDGKDIILELIRYRHPQKTGVFGPNWNILLPYQMEFSKEEIMYQGILMPKKIKVKDLIWGREEELIFSNKENIIGYVPKDKEKSRFLILAIMTDGSYRLADKLGNEFWFDEDGSMTDMFFSKKHRIHYDYLDINDGVEYFKKAPYQIILGDKYIRFRSALIPEKVKVKDPISGKEETLIFNDDRYTIVGYVPEDEKESKFRILALLSNLSFQLLDKDGREFAFDPAGRFMGMSAKQIRSVSEGQYMIKFVYDFSNNGSLKVAEAKLYEKGKESHLYAVHYKYDQDGRLYQVIRPTKKVINAAKKK